MKTTARDHRAQGSDERAHAWAVAGAWTLFGVFVLAAGLGIWFEARAYATHAPRQVGFATQLARLVPTMGFLIPMFAFALTGAFIVTRRARNTVGWVMLLAGTIFGVSGSAASYGLLAIGGSPSDPPMLGVVASVAEFPTFTLGMVLGLVLVPMLFPDGHLPSRRWRPVAWVAGLLAVLDAVRSVFTPRLSDSLHAVGREPIPVYDIANPLTLEWMQPVASAVSAVGLFVALGSVVAAAAAVVVRFRRSEGVERQQMKWFAYAAAVVGLFASMLAGGAALEAPPGLNAALFITAATAYPVAVGVAVLRYRLYEIDRIISRTVSYGLVVAVLAGVYVAGVVGLGAAVTALTGQGDSDLVVAVSTLAAAGLFRPVRNRIQTAVDRRFNRTGYEARRAVEAFTRDVRDEVDLDRIREQLAETAAVATQPTRVSVWLADEEAEA